MPKSGGAVEPRAIGRGRAVGGKREGFGIKGGEEAPPGILITFAVRGGLGRTDQEISLVCRTEDTPALTIERDDGWRGFRIQGILDFSLIGILSKLSGILAEYKIGIFAVSTYNTDYILVKEENFERALSVLNSEGYLVV